MTPISQKKSNSSEWESFFQYEEDSQKSTTQKSSEVAQAVFSSPSQAIEDRALLHSLDAPDYLLSPSDIRGEEESYYEQGSFSLEELFDRSTGYKRKAPPNREFPSPKCSRLSEPEGFQDRVSVSNEQQISSFLEPFENEEKSISQLDGLCQMVDPFEVFGFSREEWMSRFALPTPDSREEFMEEGLAYREETVDFHESLDVTEKEPHEQIKERSELSKSSEVIEQQTESSEMGSCMKKFQIKNLSISDKEEIILRAIHQSPSSGASTLSLRFGGQDIDISPTDVVAVFKRCQLTTKTLRNDAIRDGWLIPKPLPSREATSQESNDWLVPTNVLDDSIKQKVIALVSKFPEWGYFEITRNLRMQGIRISFSTIIEFLREECLNTVEKRKEAFGPNPCFRKVFRSVILPTQTFEKPKEIEPSQKSDHFRGHKIVGVGVREKAVLPSQKKRREPLKRNVPDQCEQRKQVPVVPQMQNQTLSNPSNSLDDQISSDYRIEDFAVDLGINGTASFSQARGVTREKAGTAKTGYNKKESQRRNSFEDEEVCVPDATHQSLSLGFQKMFEKLTARK